MTQQVTENEQLSIDVLSDLKDVIVWTDNSSARSQQVAIGPSELGSECNRRLAYRIAGVPEVNGWRDPLPAIVGTAVHSWLEKAINSFQAVHYMDRWETELTVHPDPLVVGHCDLYDKDLHMVIDWKTVNATKLKAWKRLGPPEHFLSQVNLYAKGLIATGRPVRKVALVAIPRAGFLADAIMSVFDYDPALAQASLDRMYGLADELLGQQQIDFAGVQATPDDGCTYCPWYRGGSKAADLSGCAGNAVASKEKFLKGLGKSV